ncbi:IS256 family transposase, partial [Salmonella enterica subsp. enterica serovar Typhimurium]|nr:IS256 family transposase [Salmonella enterica subsp. enterica serovar Typhimurium]
PGRSLLRKGIYTESWTGSNWRLAMSRFIIEFGDRLSDHL